MTTRPDATRRLLRQRVRDLFMMLAIAQMISVIISVLAMGSRRCPPGWAGAVMVGWAGWWIVARRVDNVTPLAQAARMADLRRSRDVADPQRVAEPTAYHPRAESAGHLRRPAGRRSEGCGLIVAGLAVAPTTNARDFAQFGGPALLPFALVLLKELLERHDRLVQREAALRIGGETVGGLLERWRLYEVAVETAFSLSSSLPAARVSLMISSGAHR
jgi:hypothetical protein